MNLKLTSPSGNALANSQQKLEKPHRTRNNQLTRKIQLAQKVCNSYKSVHHKHKAVLFFKIFLGTLEVQALDMPAI